VFFLVFLPQFVTPNEGPVAQQVLFLGILYVMLAIFTDGGYALLAGSVRRSFGGCVAQGPLPRCASGVMYIGLGVRTALTDRAEPRHTGKASE
jgi:threonine/homoserine/homoserine lactone efflux protein